MSSIINIGEIGLKVIEHDGQRVVTLAMVDSAHGRPDGTARRNFNENKPRFIEGEDYFVRNSSEARTLGITAPNGLALLTESGYLMLVKSFTDDMAWEVQRKLVKSYFRKPEVSADPMVALNDPAAMRGLLLTYSEKVLALEDRITEQAPKVEVHDRIAGSTGTLCLRDAAKALQMQPIKLNQWMQANNWIYRRLGKGAWTAYQERIQSGQLTHKLTSYFDEQTGDNKVSEQVRVTGKGLTLLAKRLNVELGPTDVPVGMLVVVPPNQAGARL